VGRVYNVAEPDNFTELEWTRKICEVAGWQGEGRLAPRARADSARIRNELGYQEPVSVDEGIRRTLSCERNRQA